MIVHVHVGLLAAVRALIAVTAPNTRHGDALAEATQPGHAVSCTYMYM